MTAAPTITLTFPEADIAVLTFDMPDKSANVLSRSVLVELHNHLDALEKRKDLAGLVVRSGKPGTFIAGADLREFVASLDVEQSQVVEMARRGQMLFARLSKCPFVTVCAIDGVCVGGGAELACWCDRRVISNSSRSEIGFPEVKIGLFPGWGGTVRAPRLIGLANAVEMIASGDSVDAASSYALGLVSDLVPPEKLLDSAIRIIRIEQSTGAYRRDRERLAGPIGIPDTELGFLGVTASAFIKQQTKGQYPAPEAALEVLLEGAMQDAESALQREAEGMAKLFGGPVNAALLNVFFLTDRNKKDPGVTSSVPARPIKRVGVIGAGIMGSGIAAANVKRELPVVLNDSAPEALAKGQRAALEEVAYDRKKRGPDPEKMAKALPLLTAAVSDADLPTCDLVIEAAVENQDVKRKIYERLESRLAADAILASNTSTIPITSLAQSLQRPEQFCGIHFFNPVRRMKLVEVIRGKKTSDETVATAVAYVKRIGKMPIVVNDGPGFLVNRLLFPYMQESMELLREGLEIKQIERAARAFGMPMGPIELYDMVGLDTALYAGHTMSQAFPNRITDSPILPAMVKAGRLGQKNGLGFLSYKNKKKQPEPDPALKDVLAGLIGSPKKMTPEELTGRLFLPTLLEATRVLQEQIVRDPRDIDLGLIFGIGFPPFRGGLMFWADTLGAAKIVEMLKPFAALGERMQPTPMLQDMARTGGKFYQG
jgi:3-hydroxyacyl-CoA dehydrogenase/enoyl-CoA hydratase/3-hydroxybutyryl-CoA epimerase/3-hydroxyacyl-CoA dehydrogenase/enoyl-CoA hydratase/3-hydroxybutyryl-CoA epimerase/enoyl-CoA isomerase